MFTGIIEEIGKVISVGRNGGGYSLKVSAEKVLEGTKVGESISCNGVCLTVTEIGRGYFCVDVMPETMNRTNIGGLKSGASLNLERALSLASRLGGHIVSGHIDGVGMITALRRDNNAIRMVVSAPGKILRYIVEKGSVAIDGISLTVVSVDEKGFEVSIIPHTQRESTLVAKNVGDSVNIENDLIAKYLEKLTGHSENRLTLDFLNKNGFN
jgi:riboflavin synthase